MEKVTVESTSDYWRIWFYLLEARGLDVQLVNARDVKNVPRQAEDGQAGRGVAGQAHREGTAAALVRAAQARAVRCVTTPARNTHLTQDRTRCWNRLEKLLEDALIKVSSVASTLDTLSTREMIEALIRGERDPWVLAGLARGRMRSKRAELVEALTGQFEDHHAELARILMDQIDTLTREIDKLTIRVEELIDAIAAAPPPRSTPALRRRRPTPGGEPTTDPATRPLPAVLRLAEIPGLSLTAAQMILAEVGWDMTRFPTAGTWSRGPSCVPAPSSPDR